MLCRAVATGLGVPVAVEQAEIVVVDVEQLVEIDLGNAGVDAAVGEWIGARSLAECMSVFEDRGVTAAPVYDSAQIADDQHFQARPVLTRRPDSELGSVLMHDVTTRLSRTPGAIRSPAPGSRPRQRRHSRPARPRRRQHRRTAVGRAMTTITPRAIPAWRSLLFVPANVPRFVRKAAGLQVDIVILDLEDSIAPDAKAGAREAAVAAAAELQAAGRTVFARINQPLDLAVRDVEVALTGSMAGLVLPKIGGPDHVELLSELVAKRERAAGIPEGATRFIVIIESCSGFAKMREIASSDRKRPPRNATLIRRRCAGRGVDADRSCSRAVDRRRG